MIELTNLLLPDLPSNLNWVYGIVYIIMTIAFLTLLLMPVFTIFLMIKRKKRF